MAGPGRGRVAHDDDRCIASSGGNRFPCYALSLLIDDQQCRPAVVQQVGDLGCDQTEIEGNRDRPETHDASERLDVLGPIGHEDRDPPAHADAEAGERRGDPVEPGVELLIRDPTAVRPHGDVNRLHVRMPADEAGPGDGVRLQQLEPVMFLAVIHVHSVSSPARAITSAPLLDCGYRPVTSVSSRASVSSMSRRVFFE